VIRVHHPERPDSSFEAAEPDLEDVYFTRMQGATEPEAAAVAG
jgi:hypothetical protein